MRVLLGILAMISLLDLGICRPLRLPRDYNTTIDMTAQVQMCGKKLSDLLQLVCGGKFNSPRGNKILGPKSGEGLVAECCKKPCTYIHISTSYCKDGKASSLFREFIHLHPSKNNPQLSLSSPDETKAVFHNNEVRKRATKKSRRERENNLGDAITMQCMYPTFAHFLLDRKRKGKIIKKPNGIIIGTVAPIELGGRPMVVHPTG